MSTDPTIKVEGLNEYVRDLKRLDPELVSEIKAVNRELAEDVAAAARTEAPRLAGTLIESIRAGATQRSGTVKVGKASVPYAGPIHFGWPAHNIEPNTFMWDALDSRRDDIERQYIERVTTIAERVMG